MITKTERSFYYVEFDRYECDVTFSRPTPDGKQYQDIAIERPGYSDYDPTLNIELKDFNLLKTGDWRQIVRDALEKWEDILHDGSAVRHTLGGYDFCIDFALRAGYRGYVTLTINCMSRISA